MSNMMPGDNSGAEPRDHYGRCRTNCGHADHVFDHDAALDLFMHAEADLSWWKPDKSIAMCEVAQQRMAAAAHLVECPLGHRSHECNCEDIDSDVDW